MSKYKLARFPQDRFRFQVYDNAPRLSWQKIKVQTGCYALINLAYFSLATFAPEDTLMVDGKWLYKAGWAYNGLLVDKDGRLTVGPDSAATWGYANGEPVYRLGGDDQRAAYYPANGSTFVGVEADGSVNLLLAPKDTPITSHQGIAALSHCRHILRYDGSWSSQGSLGPGLDVDPSQERIVRSYLLVFERDKREDKPTKYTVCLDPGHGVETAGKRSPDGTYLEHEFNFDMANRVKAILERHGICVSMTRSTAKDVSLEQRVKVANGIAGLNLFVSLHSNASGDGWTIPDGYGIYTSMAGATAGRNVAANKLLARAKEAGIKLWGNGLFHDGLYVLKNTAAPAILVEHGFHTNKAEVELLKSPAYRDKLAEVDAKGILDYLGVPWQDEKPQEVKWYAGAQKWAVDAGISDGTRPEDSVTRAEVWAMLQRLAER